MSTSNHEFENCQARPLTYRIGCATVKLMALLILVVLAILLISMNSGRTVGVGRIIIQIIKIVVAIIVIKIILVIIGLGSFLYIGHSLLR